MALLVGSLAFLLAGCTLQDVEDKLRWGWPRGITKEAEQMRVLWTWAGVAALAVGVLVWGLIFWCIIRYRKRNDELPRQTKYNLPVEIIYSVLPFFLIAGLFYRTVIVENNVNHLSKNPDVLVKTVAFKWNWQFDYLEDHGEKTNYEDSDQPLSTIGSDDLIPVLVIPKGQKVQFIEHSPDVIHSFWVPEFLFKRDVIPYGPDHTDMDNRFEVQATTLGNYVGRCAELCGTYHSQMNFELRVVEPDVFKTYLDELRKIGPDDPNKQAKALKAAGMEPYATTTYPFDTDRTMRHASLEPEKGAS